MAEPLGTSVLELKTDATGLDKGLADAHKRAQGLQGKFDQLSKRAVALGKQMTTFVTLPILALGAAFVKAAADAGETNSKFNAVFKEQAESVRTWANEFSEATGRSTTANIAFLATIQDTLVPLGFLRERAAEMSKATITLATDLASFNNLPTEQVIQDIQSALVGNTETLRKYGVVASQAAIIEEALNSGLIANKNELDATSKAQAIYNILLASTTDAQGDAIRTADSIANQFVALKSAVQDLAIAFGNELIPFTQVLVGALRDIVGWFTDLHPATKKIILIVGGLVAAIGPLLLGIGLLAKAFATLNLTMLANPVFLITTGTIALAAAIAGLGLLIHTRKVDRARRAQQAFNDTLDSGMIVAGQMTESLNELAAELGGLIGATIFATTGFYDTAEGAVKMTEEVERLERILKQLHARMEEEGPSTFLQREIETTTTMLETMRETLADTNEELGTSTSPEQYNRLLQGLINGLGFARNKFTVFGDEVDFINEKLKLYEGFIEDVIEGNLELNNQQFQLVIAEYRELLAVADNLFNSFTARTAAVNTFATGIDQLSFSFGILGENLLLVNEALLAGGSLGTPLAALTFKDAGFTIGEDFVSNVVMASGEIGEAIAEPLKELFKKGRGVLQVEPSFFEGPAERHDVLPQLTEEASPAMLIDPVIAMTMMALGMLGEEMENVALLMDPVSLLFKGFVEVAGPAMAMLNEALVPVVGAVMMLGRVLGMILVPVFELLATTILPALVHIFVFLYNNALRPLASMFIFIATVIRNLGQFITNIVNRPFRPGTWNQGMINPFAAADLPAISVGDLTAAGDSVTGGDDDTTAVGATFRQQRPITVTVNVYDNQVFGGSLQDFAILLKRELLSIDELGL